jgi:uncharacterized membrane protein
MLAWVCVGLAALSFLWTIGAQASFLSGYYKFGFEEYADFVEYVRAGVFGLIAFAMIAVILFVFHELEKLGHNLLNLPRTK